MKKVMNQLLIQPSGNLQRQKFNYCPKEILLSNTNKAKLKKLNITFKMAFSK